MKSAIGSLIVLSAVGVCFLPGGSNVLENPSFETGDATGWSEPQEILGSVGAPGVGAQDGSFAIQLTQPGGGGVPEIRQIMPASPGEIWEMRGFMLTENALPSGPSFGLFKIVFQNSCGADLLVENIEIGGQNFDFPGIESTPFLDFNQMTDTWVESVAKGTAPAGTVRVVLLGLNVDFGGGENPLWFDSISVFKDNDPTNLVANPGFETGDTTGWTGVFAPPFVGEPSGAMAQDGSFAMKLNGNAGGGVASVAQTFPVVEGDEVSLSGFLLTESGLPSGAFGLYKIVFRDIDGNLLEPGSITMGQPSGDPNFPGIESQPFVDENSTPNSWIESTAAGTAPAGAVEVGFEALNVDFGDGENPIWIDNVTASVPTEDCILGDLNGDGVINLLDVTGFVEAITTGEFVCEADINEDGAVNLVDVGPFIDLL